MKLKYRIERLFMRFASISRQVDGLWVGSLGDKKDEVLLQRVEDALMLIKQYDPPRYQRLIRDLERIWVYPIIGARGNFNIDLNTCGLGRKFVESSTPAQIASTIVHEATHAKPSMRKLGYSEERRYRIERICMLEQLAFALKIPDEPKIREEVEQMLALPESFWSDKEYAERFPVNALAATREAGIPDWISKTILTLNKLRRAKR